MYRLIMAILALFMLGGCIQSLPSLLAVGGSLSSMDMETMEKVKRARGEGDIRIYSYPYDTVYTATLIVATEQGLKMVEQDKKKGVIILKHGMTLATWGESVALFLASLPDSETEVEFIIKHVQKNVHSPDWTNILIKAIEKKLRATR